MDEGFAQQGEKMVLFNYATKHLNNTEKVKFYYALKGRDGKSGLVKALRLTQLGKGVLLAPVRHGEEVEDFFKLWNLSFSKRLAIIGKETFGGQHAE